MAVERTDKAESTDSAERPDRAEKLTKAEIIESIYAEVPVSKKNIHRILDLFFDQVKAGIIGQRAVELRGFGTFELKPRKGRVARNPRTGERVEVENHGVASFRPGRELKERAWSSRV